MKETFFQICIIFSILLIVFNVSIVFVNAIDVFGSEVESGIAIEGDDTSDNIFHKLTGYSEGAQGIWTVILGVSGILSIGVAILMHSAVPVGVWIFSEVFWTSYTALIGIVNINNIFTSEPLSYFLLIFTVGLLFVWMGALAGMFSGSG